MGLSSLSNLSMEIILPTDLICSAPIADSMVLSSLLYPKVEEHPSI